MKNKFNRTGVVLANGLALTALGGVLLLAPALASASAVTQYDWRFDTSASPVSPEVASASAPNLRANVTPGPLSDGWQASNPLFGSAQGVWDLGREGSIILTNSTGLGGALSEGRSLTVKVKQWFDGGIYNTAAKVSVPGAQFVSSSESLVPASDFGEWLITENKWNVTAGVAVTAAVITGADTGSLVDSVTLLSASLSGDSPVLTIRAGAGGTLELSWPSAFSGMKLQPNANLANLEGWNAVALPVQISGGLCTVSVNAVGSVQFYRLKLP